MHTSLTILHCFLWTQNITNKYKSFNKSNTKTSIVLWKTTFLIKMLNENNKKIFVKIISKY